MARQDLAHPQWSDVRCPARPRVRPYARITQQVCITRSSKRSQAGLTLWCRGAAYGSLRFRDELCVTCASRSRVDTAFTPEPVAGSRVDAGATVTLTLLAPAPTATPGRLRRLPRAHVSTCRAGTQAGRPGTRPVAPAPAPAPAPARGRVITPGAFCKKTEVGSVEKSAEGDSYRCAPDAAGQRNRWYPI
jgi:hypothetical protein